MISFFDLAARRYGDAVRSVMKLWLTATLAVLLGWAQAIALPVLTERAMAAGQQQDNSSYYNDQFDLPGCPQPIAIHLPEPFLPVSKSQVLTDFLNKQIKNNTFSAVYKSSFYVHKQWAVPSTVSIGVLNNDQEMQGSFTHDDFMSINARIAEGLIERSAKIKNYLNYVAKTRPEEYETAKYLFDNTFYLNDNRFVYYDISTVNVADVYNIQKLNAANFIYLNGCIMFISVEIIENLISFADFHKVNAELTVGVPQANTPRYSFAD